jgi:MFS family permease
MLLWGGQALSELGSQASTIAYPLLVLALTGSAAKAGIVGFAKFVPLPLFALPSGVIVDRVNRKILMMACDGIRATALASIPIAFVLGQPTFAQVVGVAFIDGALFATSYIAERGALRQIVPPEQIPQAVAQNEGRTFAASIAGPPLGGLLFSAGRALTFLVDAISYSASTVALALTRGRFQQPRGDPPRPVRREIVERLSREINASLADSGFKARIAVVGDTAFANSPADFTKLIAEDAEKWGKVIRAANIKPE